MGQVDSLNHKSIKVEVEVRTGIAIRGPIRTGTDQIIDQIVGDRGQYRQDSGRPRYKQKYRRGIFRGNMRSYGRENNRVQKQL